MIESIDVEVVQAQRRAVVLAGQRERRTHHLVGDAEAAGEALRERGLAGAHVAGEQHEVAGMNEPGDGGAERTRLVDARRLRMCHECSTCFARTRSARMAAMASGL